MASLKEAAGITSELNELTDQLHSELSNGGADFRRMAELADAISRQADELATTFAQVDEALTRSAEEQEARA
jgi:ABC-type transporter Mla subunit MlaD